MTKVTFTEKQLQSLRKAVTNEIVDRIEAMQTELEDLRTFRKTTEKGYNYHESEAKKNKEQADGYKRRVVNLRAGIQAIPELIRKVQDPWAGRVHEAIQKVLAEDK